MIGEWERERRGRLVIFQGSRTNGIISCFCINIIILKELTEIKNIAIQTIKVTQQIYKYIKFLQSNIDSTQLISFLFLLFIFPLIRL